MDNSFQLLLGQCHQIIPLLENDSFDLCLTSPPYANQRNKLYPGISEKEYPSWTCQWMTALYPKLKEFGSVLIVIRSSVHNGEVSDYVLRTRLAVRDVGYKECEELIWHKPDAPPLGSRLRPRRTFEQILWFSKSKNPFCDLYACGNAHSKRSGGYIGSTRFGEGVVIAKHQNHELKNGTSRVTDVFTAAIGSLPKNVMHPAMYPKPLTDKLVQTFSPVGGRILDPFCGSGQTGLSALEYGRTFTGIDCTPEYLKISSERLGKIIHKTI